MYAVTNVLIGRASFTDYSKATRVSKFYTAYTRLVESYYPTCVSNKNRAYSKTNVQIQELKW